MVNRVWKKVLKTKRYVKTNLAVGAVMVVVCCSVSVVFAKPIVKCDVSKSFLTKEAESNAEKAAVTGVVIEKKNGNVLASGETPFYGSNGSRYKWVSYTGLSSAYKAWAYALDVDYVANKDDAFY